MATTGTFSFSPSIAEAVDEAWERCGLNPENLTARHAKSALRSIAYMLSHWPNKGLLQWTIEIVTHQFVQGVASFALPAGAIDILEANLMRDECGEIPMSPWNRQQYFSVTNKDSQGRPSNYFVERTITPTVYVWPAPENSTDVMRYYRTRHLEDAGRLSNTIDIPTRYQQAFVSGLAAELAPKFAPDREMSLRESAERAMREARNEDRERGDFVLTTKQGGYRRR